MRFVKRTFLALAAVAALAANSDPAEACGPYGFCGSPVCAVRYRLGYPGFAGYGAYGPYGGLGYGGMGMGYGYGGIAYGVGGYGYGGPGVYSPAFAYGGFVAGY